MNTYYKNNLSFNSVSFCYTNSHKIEEREFHAYHEILYYQNGDAVFFSENSQEEIKADTLFIIPREKYHYFSVNSAKEFKRLKITFPDTFFNNIPCEDIVSEVKIIKTFNVEIKSLLEKIINCLTSQNEKSAFYAYAAFLNLLVEIEALNLNGTDNGKQLCQTTKSIIEYISNNLSSQLSIKELSERFNMCSSSLSHLFKKEIGISVHSYITQRRLMYAHSLILAGKRPSKIYFDCGYNNYSTFYKAYLKYFGFEPSKSEKI